MLATVALFSGNAVCETVLSEDFSKFAAGTEDAPDKTTLTSAKTTPRWVIPSEYTSQPGWTSFYVFQAGGVAYLPKEKPTDDLAPSLNTPKLDLSANDGIYKVKFRARLKDAKLTADRLYVQPSTTSGNSQLVDVTSEWQNYSVTMSQGTADCSVQFWTLRKGDFMIDDIEISTGGGLPVPEVYAPEGYNRKSFTARWSAVEGATSYELSVFCFPNGDAQREYLDGFKDKEVTDTYCFVDGLKSDETYFFTVRAKNAEMESAESKATKVRVAALDAPEALAATNVNETGFTANWNPVDLATGYYADLWIEHKAQTDGAFDLINTDFSKVTSGALNDPTSYGEGVFPLDSFVGRAGWYVNNVALANGYIGTDNRYAYYYGESYIASPDLDYSLDGGKTTVEFTTMNQSNTPVKVTIEYDTYNENNQLVPIKESQQVVEVPAGESKQSVTLSGGIKNCKILILPDATNAIILFFDDLRVSQALKAGESQAVKVDRKTATSTATSCDFTIDPISEGDRYAYTITAYYLGDNDDENVVSDPSNMVYVTGMSGVAQNSIATAVAAYVADGVLHISNANGSSVQVFDASGALVFATANAGDSIEVVLPSRGLYIAKVGNEVFKVLR